MVTAAVETALHCSTRTVHALYRDSCIHSWPCKKDHFILYDHELRGVIEMIDQYCLFVASVVGHIRHRMTRGTHIHLRVANRSFEFPLRGMSESTSRFDRVG